MISDMIHILRGASSMPAPLPSDVALRSLLRIETVMDITSRDEDAVLNMIQTGRLLWAWDIRGPDSARREVRVWRESLSALLAGAPQPEDDPVERLIPHRDPRSTEIRLLLGCSSTHIYSLIESRALTSPDLGRGARSGPNSYVHISRASLVTFLRSRRML